MKSKLLFLFYFFLGFNAFSQNYSIPSQQILLNDFFPNIQHTHDIKINVKKFEISKQVTLKEYKIFLEAVKKDSGETVYQSLLPDTTIGPKNIRDKYFNSGEFDDFPVVGISWDNALRYCKWLTVKNNTDTIKIMYRLPNIYEYLSAYSYLQKSAMDNDLNYLYADWLMDAKDESVYDNGQSVPMSFYYFHLKSDPNVLKRKLVIGKSFHHAFSSFEDYLNLSFYAQEGYNHIGFRIVTDSNSETFKTSEKRSKLIYDHPLLNYWRIIPKVK